MNTANCAYPDYSETEQKRRENTQFGMGKNIHEFKEKSNKDSQRQNESSNEKHEKSYQ